LLLAGASDGEVAAVIRSASVEPGKVAKVVRLVDGSAPGWAPSRQGLTLFLPTKGRGLSADQVLLAWSNADKAQGGEKGDGGPQASLKGALVKAKRGALEIFEGLLDTIEKLEKPTEKLMSALSKDEANQLAKLEAKLQADHDAKRRAERRTPYGRLDEALRLLLVPAWPPAPTESSNLPSPPATGWEPE
jgi:hypothetical protein